MERNIVSPSQNMAKVFIMGYMIKPWVVHQLSNTYNCCRFLEKKFRKMSDR
jgi:hypothetical protein